MRYGTDFTVEVLKMDGRRTPRRVCRCGKHYLLRHRRSRRYPDLCPSCAMSQAKTDFWNRNRGEGQRTQKAFKVSSL